MVGYIILTFATDRCTAQVPGTGNHAASVFERMRTRSTINSPLHALSWSLVAHGAESVEQAAGGLLAHPRARGVMGGSPTA